MSHHFFGILLIIEIFRKDRICDNLFRSASKKQSLSFTIHFDRHGIQELFRKNPVKHSPNFAQFRKNRLPFNGFVVLLLLFVVPALTRAQTLRINEFMASNQNTLTDKDGDYSDWIEIYNPTAAAVNLARWSLTDDKNEPRKWLFPQADLGPGSYLVVFASGNDIAFPGEELHTNFKIDAAGEFLALFDADGGAVGEFDPFPPQRADKSYAYFEGDYLVADPTPGAENLFQDRPVAPAPLVDRAHGFYASPFTVTLTSELANACIYYTTDAGVPTEETGTLYTTPVAITTTTVLRAIAVKDGYQESSIVTRTFLFLDDVMRQPNDPPGYPAAWGPYTAISGTAIADYGMDWEVIRDPLYGDEMQEALLSIPTLSIVTDKDNLFSQSTDSQTGGIYIYTGPPGDGDVPLLGDGWERPASAEYITRDGSQDFQIDCGLRIHGGHSRRPEKSPKHSFRLMFKSEYGSSRLDFPLFGDGSSESLNTLILRATYGNTWLHMSSSERKRGQLIRDLWGKETQIAMGHPAGHGNYVHLYLNGLYWGIYNPTERIDKEFAAAYLSGNAEDYDVIKDYGEVVDGNDTAWNEMFTLARAGLESDDNYQRIQGNNPDGTPNPDYRAYLDMVNFIDYMLLNFYGSNWDWDHHNWIAARNRVHPEKGFKFFSWDAEHILELISSNILAENNSKCPSELFQRLRENQNFCRLVGDRAQFLFFNGGPLSPEAGRERYLKLARQIETAIIAESARWGDYRRDVHPYSGGPYALYTKEHWLAEQSFLVDQYFPQRTGVFISDLKEANLYPQVSAPTFLINGEQVVQYRISAGDVLTMSAPAGTIYYTTDGTDPWLVESSSGSALSAEAAKAPAGNGISPSAIVYTVPITLDQSTHIKARAINGSEWSALIDVIISLQDDMRHLKITEIHYHPQSLDGISEQSLEFIELKNTGESPVDLSAARFCRGISYTFPMRTIINANGFIVLASNKEQFAAHYGFAPFDQYAGQLDNSGERIALVDAAGDTVISLRYNDKAPWPASADGLGYSLVLRENSIEDDPNIPDYWRASQAIDGSPGKDDPVNTMITDGAGSVPASFLLEQNYPNPFNDATIISYSLPQQASIRLMIYDIAGRMVIVAEPGSQPAGAYRITWDCRDRAGNSIAGGIYFCVLEARNPRAVLRKSIKLLLIR
jgi:hypothetical protein